MSPSGLLDSCPGAFVPSLAARLHLYLAPRGFRLPAVPKRPAALQFSGSMHHDLTPAPLLLLDSAAFWGEIALSKYVERLSVSSSLRRPRSHETKITQTTTRAALSAPATHAQLGATVASFTPHFAVSLPQSATRFPALMNVLNTELPATFSPSPWNAHLKRFAPELFNSNHPAFRPPSSPANGLVVKFSVHPRPTGCFGARSRTVGLHSSVTIPPYLDLPFRYVNSRAKVDHC
ncbi:hypothetical protein C8R46DRAFT_1197423 [Mycena filopes]|nr:hypothetical protein C8R46DRAFT_1197423 [Mycena filopes]